MDAVCAAPLSIQQADSDLRILQHGRQEIFIMAEHTITIQNLQFNPPDGEPVVIAVGDSVKWVNRDNARHDARRDAAPTFRTRLLNKDETSDPVVFRRQSHRGCKLRSNVH